MPPGLRGAAWLVAAALVTGTAWLISIPPFESPDESVYFKSITSSAPAGTIKGLPLYDLLMKPIVALARADPRPFQVQYNPSFRFVSNRYGRVNMFMHGHSEKALRADLARLTLLRAVTLSFWIVALLLIYLTARWYFARDDLALATAILCLSIPGLSFFSSKVHPEGLTAVIGAAAYAILVARADGRIGRLTAWGLALLVMALTPFSDRQGFFVLLLLPFGLVVTERRWRDAAITVGVLVLPAAILLLLPQFSHLQTEIRDTLIGSFSPAHSGGMFSLENRRYFAFEALPKLFFGFWGWLGQPSILLPPLLYAGFAVVLAIGVGGLLLRRDRETPTPARTRMAWIFAAGILLTLAPIVYANLFISRNLWHGRWLYPSVGPIVIAMITGWRTSASFARRRPVVSAGVLLASAALLETLWLTAPGDFIRAGIVGFHYGDRSHFASTIAMTIVMLAVTGVIAAILPRLRWRLGTARGPLLIAATAWSGNLLLLAVFVVPLYRPFDEADFVAGVRAEIEDAEPGRASALYRIARVTYPESAALRRLAEDRPTLMLAGADDEQIAELQGRIARGESLRTREELMALARAIRVKGWFEPAAIRSVIDRGAADGGGREIDEPIELLRLALSPQAGGPAAANVIRAGGGVVLATPIQDKIRIEGYTTHPESGGRTEVTVYFRPLQKWRGRVLWLQAFPEGVGSFITFDPAPPAFDGWQPGELAWDRFILPPGRFSAFVGITEGSVSSQAAPLGLVPR